MYKPTVKRDEIFVKSGSEYPQRRGEVRMTFIAFLLSLYTFTAFYISRCESRRKNVAGWFARRIVPLFWGGKIRRRAGIVVVSGGDDDGNHGEHAVAAGNGKGVKGLRLN